MNIKNTKYNNLTEIEKINLLNNLYINHEQSFAEIAAQYNTYANKIRRDAIKFNIPIRDKSEAQKNALKNNKVVHPTKGRQRTQNEKDKIGLGVYSSWESMDQKTKEKRKKKSKELWNNLSDDQKQLMFDSAHRAIRQSSKYGSKLEKFILTELLAIGYKVDFHKEQILSNTKLQIDLFLPSLNTAIEIDGPSHYEAVWGDDALAKNKKYDSKKTSLILGKGMRLIRIKQTGDFSTTRAKLVLDKLQETLLLIQNNIQQKLFNIED